MRVVATEEHFVTTSVMDAWRSLDPAWQDLALGPSTEDVRGRRLREIGPERLGLMDDVGVDTQVLSLGPPGLQNLEPDTAVALQSETNDHLAEVVRGSDRYEGFAALATPAPEKAADELERAVRTLGLEGAMVYGRTRERNFDHPDFWPIFEAASALRAPLYLHAQSPPLAVREAYYSGFDPALAAGLATAGIGWHYETGVQVVRMMLAGVFDRFPDLQIILGHWGEVALFYLDRVDELWRTAGVAKRPSEYARSNVIVTAGGLLDQRYLRWSIEMVGIERVLFASDYPFVSHSSGAARRFLEEADLSETERSLIASDNWAALRAGIRR